MRLETQLEELKTTTALCLRCMVCTYGKWPDNHPLCALYETNRTYTGSPGGLIYLVKALSEKWADYSPEIAKLSYECTLCQACDLCEIIPVPPPHATPSDLIRFLRQLSVKSGLAPEKVRQYQTELRKDGLDVTKFSLKIQNHAKNIPGVVLFVSGSSKAEREMHKNALSLLTKMGLEAAILEYSGACWADLYDLGLWDELKQAIDWNADEMAVLKGKEVVFVNPHNQEFFTKSYGTISSLNVPMKTKHLSEILRDALKKGKLKAIKDKPMKVAYHDPCRLSRGLGIHTAPRDVLKLLNLEIVEMKRNREDTTVAEPERSTWHMELFRKESPRSE